jgi:hypothetical protein
MSVQVCEGVFRQKCGRYVAVIPCDRRDGGQLWTDGIIHYFNDGTVTFEEGGSVVDLVEYIGPFPGSSQPDQSAEIKRLQDEWQSEFTAAQQLRSEVQQLEGLNYKLSEALRDLQEDHTAMDHRAEGARLAFLDVIKTLLEMRR